MLASDSQGTHGALRRTTPKLFRTEGLIWGTSGPLAGSQAVFPILQGAKPGKDPRREETKRIVSETMRQASQELAEPARGSGEWFQGLFGWYDRAEDRHYLLRARHDGVVEFMRPYDAIGSSADLGSFGFARAAFLDYKTLPVETTKMLAYTVAEDAIRASARAVSLPIQMAVASDGQAAVLGEPDLEPIRDTAAAFQMRQRDFLIRSGAGELEPGDSGLIPGSGD